MENNPKKSKAVIITIIALIILLIGGFFLYQNKSAFGIKSSGLIGRIFTPLSSSSNSKDVNVIDKNIKKVTAQAGEDIKNGDLVTLSAGNNSKNPIIMKAKAGDSIWGVASEDLIAGSTGLVTLNQTNSNNSFWGSISGFIGQIFGKNSPSWSSDNGGSSGIWTDGKESGTWTTTSGVGGIGNGSWTGVGDGTGTWTSSTGSGIWNNGKGTGGLGTGTWTSATGESSKINPNLNPNSNSTWSSLNGGTSGVWNNLTGSGTWTTTSGVGGIGETTWTSTNDGLSGLWSSATGSGIWQATAGTSGLGSGTWSNFSISKGPFPSVTLTATPSSILSGASSKMEWVATDATTCVSSTGDGGNGLKGTFSTGALNKSQSFSIRCTGAGGSISANAFVYVQNTTTGGGGGTFPTVSVTATPSSVIRGKSSTIKWEALAATSCSSNIGLGGNGLTGTFVTGALTQSQSFTVSCTGPGGTRSGNVFVYVGSGGLSPIINVTASPASVATGTASTISWEAENATSCTSSSGTGGSGMKGTFSTGNLTTGKLYTIKCTGTGGSNLASVYVSVNNSGTIPVVSVTANPPTIESGSESTIEWIATNDPTSCSSNTGAGGTEATGTFPTGPLTAGKLYTVKCTGVTGIGIGNVFVNVNNFQTSIPDLIVGNIRPIAGVVNNTIELSAEISNIGSGSTNQSFSNYFTIIDSKNTSVEKSLIAPTLGAKSSETIMIPYTFNTVGTYTIRVCVDKSGAADTGSISEADENNNCGSNWTTFTVTDALPKPGESCTNGAVDYSTCKILADGSCFNRATNPPYCNIFETTNVVTPPVNQCLVIEENPLTFSPEEKARLAVLLRQFYLISSTLKTEEDITTIYNEIDQQNNFILQIKNLITQCYTDVGADDTSGLMALHPEWDRHGNPWYTPWAAPSTGSFAYTNIDEINTTTGITEGYLKFNQLEGGLTPLGYRSISGYYYGTLTKAITENGVTGAAGGSCEQFNNFQGYGLSKQINNYPETYLNHYYANRRFYANGEGGGYPGDSLLYHTNIRLSDRQPKLTILGSGCKWKDGVILNDVERLLNIW